MTFSPIPMRWTGETFEPLNPFWKRRADAELVVGEVYRLVEHQDRSGVSHRHYFASINDAWQNLPESIAERFMAPDHLRKYALVKCGFYEERTFVASSKAEARKLAAFIRPREGFTVISVNENIVIERIAKSQNMRAMGKKEFQASKQAVLEFLAELVGIAREELEANAARAA